VGAAARTWLGLVLALCSALVVAWAYTREHDAATSLPPVSAAHPLRSARLLVTDRRWMVGFAAEGGGWVVYLLALRLAPLALVQAVSASGVALLAALTVGGHLGRLSRRERTAVLLAVGGLVLLGASLAGTLPSERLPRAVPAALWLGASLGLALLLAAGWPRLLQASSLGAAAGLLFAGGDTSAKLVVQGGGWLLAAVPLVLCYSLGSLELQSAFQHGRVLVAAGTANLVTNAVPIVAGFLLFHQALPGGWRLGVEALALAAIVTSAMLLGDRARGVGAEAEQPAPSVAGHPCASG
jgi:hypothetical protein